jgi:uncharacterized protein
VSGVIATQATSSALRTSRYNVVLERDQRVWIYNGVSGRTIALDAEDWAATLAFLDGAEHHPDLTLLRDLTLGRMIVRADLDELELLERRYRAGTSDGTTFALTIVTSLGCNFDCPYCFEAKTPQILDEETERLLLDVLDVQLPSLSRFHVTWYGGEPLLGKDRLYRLSEAFIARTTAAGVDYSARIVTNGYLLTPETAARLASYGVQDAQVTLDGPPETHDRMRPLANGRPTFDVILDRIDEAADLLPISVRVNLDTSNAAEAETLLDLLAARGLGGRITVHPGQIVALDDGAGAPSETYAPACFSVPEFARVERAFLARARELGLAPTELPQPVGSPCTAVRANELVVGARGELYKCWDSVGNHQEVVGHLRSWRDPNDRVLKWLRYDPFADEDCRGCIALPTCMGGCAHHAMLDRTGDSKCSTFRTTYREQVADFAAAADAAGATGLRHALLPLVAIDG